MHADFTSNANKQDKNANRSIKCIQAEEPSHRGADGKDACHKPKLLMAAQCSVSYLRPHLLAAGSVVCPPGYPPLFPPENARTTGTYVPATSGAITKISTDVNGFNNYGNDVLSSRRYGIPFDAGSNCCELQQMLPPCPECLGATYSTFSPAQKKKTKQERESIELRFGMGLC